MKRILTVAAAALAALMLLAGCAGNSAPQTEDSMAYDYAPAAEEAGYAYEAAEMEMPMPMPADAPAAADGDRSTVTPDYGGRKVIRNLYISLETDAFDTHMQALLDRVNALGGYTESSTVDGRKPETYNEAGRSGYFVFRIPADKADEFAAAAQGYGTLISYSENAEDITSQYFDIDTRLEVLRTQHERLTSILVETDNLADVIALEQEIADVTLQIEELTTELRRYDGLIDYATVTVNMFEKRLLTGPADDMTVGERISEGFTDSLYGVGTFFENAFVWIVSALPVLLLLAAIGLGLFFLIRGGKKRRAKRAQRRANRMGMRNGQYAPPVQNIQNQVNYQNDQEEKHE